MLKVLHNECSAWCVVLNSQNDYSYSKLLNVTLKEEKNKH